MVQTSFALMTNVGRAKEAAALANGTPVVITQIAIGDGATVPSGGETALYNEIARKAISGHGTVTGASNVAYFDIYLAAADGPYTIREAGLYDDTGALIAIAHYDPPINKPVPSSGTTVEGVIRLEVAFSNVANITIVVDPSFQVALQRLSRLPWIPVISMSITAPPAAVAGDCYLIPTGATGSWSGNAGKIAEYTTAGWAMITAAEGHGISLPDGRIFEKISGAYVEKIALDAQSGKWNYAVAAGTANALTATIAPVPTALVAGMRIRLKIASANTGAMTLNLNGTGAVAIQKGDASVIGASYFLPNEIATLTYTGTVWQAENVARRSGDVFSTALNTIVPLRVVGGPAPSGAIFEVTYSGVEALRAYVANDGFHMDSGSALTGAAYLFGGPGGTRGSLSMGTDAQPQFGVEVLQAAGNFASSAIFLVRGGINANAYSALTLAGNEIWRATSSSFMVKNGGTAVFEVSATSGQVAAKGSDTAAFNVVRPSVGSLSPFYYEAGGSPRFFVDNAGGVHSTSGTIGGVSDERLKTNIEDFNDGLAHVLAWQPKTFWLSYDNPTTDKQRVGFIAQQVQPTSPRLVTESQWVNAPDGSRALEFAMGDMIPFLVNAIKEQQAQIEELRAQIAA